MKNYKQILEAINRGIKFALDDFDDQNELQGQVNSKVNHGMNTKEYLELMSLVVDLGLPSGTLWCKYNLDVDPTLLSKAEDWYGNYYAWGELEGNKIDKDGNTLFYWNNYKFGKDYDKLTKYCNHPNYGLNGFTDNLTELLPEDDAAYLNKKIHNYKFHIPTKELCEELINYTNNYWVHNYDPNKTIHNPENDGGIQGLNGRIFKGKNKNWLFIPTAGFCKGYTIYSAGYNCKLWTSRLYLDGIPSDARCLRFGLLSIKVSDDTRFYGCSVRPVLNL